MATLAAFKKGDVLFRQGDASGHVLRVRSGEIEILREVGAASVLLGHVREGEWLGEMGVIEGRCRSATARAAGDVEAEILPAQEFLERVSSEPALARELILRLSIRLRTLADKITGEALPFAQGRSKDDGSQISPEALPAGMTITLKAQSDVLRSRMGSAAKDITKLPFLIGRTPAASEAKPVRLPDLSIQDQMPFRLSRRHFVIAQSGGELVVTDLGSVLGTVVNGQSIGQHFPKDTAPLHCGDNTVTAGGFDSPFKFLLSVS